MHYSKTVQNTIDIINKKLASDLTLESLADHVHFSPYHFHRLFLLSTGEAPMEYLRRQRLRAASKDLLTKELSLLEIAASYRFECQDGFCRAFKRYYGLTPGEYRKQNTLALKSENNERIEEVHTVMYDISIYEKLSCSHDDKIEALRTLDQLLDLSLKAKTSGLLSLENEIAAAQPVLLKKSMQMLIDGIEPEALREILINYTLCGGYVGKELLVRILIIEGTLAIQQGVQPVVLREKLSAFFGEDFIEEIETYYKLDSESQRRSIDTYILKNQERGFISKETALLEEPLNRLDSRSLQRLLREIDIVTISIAISGASGKTQAKILKSTSIKTANELISEMETLGNPIISAITDSQKQILDIMHNLLRQGDIII